VAESLNLRLSGDDPVLVMTTLYCVAGLPPSVQLPAADCEMLTGQVGFEDDPEVLVDPAGEPVVVVAGG